MLGDAQKPKDESIHCRKTFRLVTRPAGERELPRLRRMHEVERVCVVAAIFRRRLAEAEVLHLGKYQFGAASPSFCCSSMNSRMP